MALRPVTVRATRIAAMTASDPVLQKVTRSLPVISEKSAAAGPANADWGPMAKPLRNCSSTASKTKGAAWPKKVWP
jgi:hypothetical protein